MSTPVIGIVGCGDIGAMYAAHLDALGPYPLICVDPDADRAAQVAEAAKTASVAASVRELLERGCDAALVTSSTASHPPLVEALVTADIPVLCEKPLATDPRETERLGILAEQRGVPLWVGFQRHFDPGFADLRARTAAGQLGRVHVLRMVSHDMTPPPTARLRASGTIFTDLMLHDFDLARWLTGRSVARVSADGAALSRPELAEIDDYDSVTAMLRLDDGALAVLTAGRWQPLGYDVRAEILGERGNLLAGPDHAQEPGEQTTPHHRGYWDRFADAYRAQLAAFLVEVAGGPHDPAAGGWRDSHAALVCARAAERSARSGAIPTAP
ncbi:Gfo/Idh/MocA family protein [Nocardia bovistercoris]|uniref:Gfo/Idh/MocA family oxidoreductase n=1 Tax=Nocardia bovistercoris TaxID=2785916 RepID=A0A931IJL1_9NOCA|nr:Gfo/Idh/MocA family oxidoreductase [Nocardia bovistercoris]MBH0780865.1 Gfo/Idh/MocA family oxidoreductase [Nocardia bovistercoris]